MSSSRSTQRHAFIRILRFFEGDIGVARIAFSLERLYYGRIFLTEFGATIFADFYLFFLGQRENNTEKKTRRNSVNENSSKVRRNTSLQERRKNEAKGRQSQTCT